MKCNTSCNRMNVSLFFLCVYVRVCYKLIRALALPCLLDCNQNHMEQLAQAAVKKKGFQSAAKCHFALWDLSVNHASTPLQKTRAIRRTYLPQGCSLLL